MKMKVRGLPIWSILLLFVVTGVYAQEPSGLSAIQSPPPPDPQPLFSSEGYQRKPLLLKVKDYTKKGETGIQTSLVMGNKAIGVLTNNGTGLDWNAGARIFIIANRKSYLSLSFFSHSVMRGTTPWIGRLSQENLTAYAAEQMKITSDSETGAITCKIPILTKKAELYYLTYILKPLEAGRAELTWETDANIPLSLALGNTSQYRDKMILFGSEKFVGAPLDEIKNHKAGSQEFTSDTLVFEPENPELNFSLSGLGDKPFKVSEGVQGVTGGGFLPTFISFLSIGKTGRIVIDLGESEFYAGKDIPLVNGLDFYKNNGFHVPLSATRNELPNPSFEEDLHYWQWTPGWGECPVTDTYTFSNDALFGKKSLLIRNHNNETLTLATLPMSLLPKQDYTASFYVKSANGKPAVVSLWIGGGNYGDGHGKGFTVGSFKLKENEDWTRFSRTFKGKNGPFRLFINAKPGSEVLIDGMQLEQGTEPTKFVCDPVEGNLVTSAAPDNDIEYGHPVDARFDFTGKPGTHAKVEIAIKNFFREVVHQETIETTIGQDGTSSAKLSPAVETLGKGVFIVEATYEVEGFEPYTKYTRYSVMTFLENTHPTHMLTGTLTWGYLTYGPRVYDYGRKLKEWGYGSTSWARFSPKDKKKLSQQIMEDNGITNVHSVLEEQVTRLWLKDEDFPNRKDDLDKMRKYQKSVARFADIPLTPDEEKKLEEACYEFCKTVDPTSALAVSWSNEEQSYPLMANKQFDEFFKYQHAAVSAAKRAMPNIQTTFSSGVCNIGHHLHVVDGWLAAAHKAGFKYDALTAHAYGGYDGGILSGWDLDTQLQKYFEIAQKYGYGKDTPFYMTEINNDRFLWIPEWNTATGDSYRLGLPTYDWGQWEFIHAASTLRQWLIALKYWPQFASTNIWQSTPFLDYHMTPLFFSKAANTVGNMLPWVEYKGDIRPTPGVRGYGYQLKDNTGIAAIWFVNKKLELSMLPNALFRVKFSQPVRFYDMMENERSVVADNDGFCEFPLTPAPLFIKAKDINLLIEDLNNGIAGFSEETREVAVRFGANSQGEIQAVVKNNVNRPQKGDLIIDGKSYPYEINPSEEQAILLPEMKSGDSFGTLYNRDIQYFIKSNKKTLSGTWNMSYFFVPETKGMPDWKNVPAYRLNNVDTEGGRQSKEIPPENEFGATYQLAWDKDNLYLRVEVTDAKFIYDPKLWKTQLTYTQLWNLDGAAEVYLDTLGDGRAAEMKGRYELDDCRFDFGMNPEGKTGPGIINRWHSVETNIGGGVGIWPTDKEFAKRVTNNWERTDKGYTYTITLPQSCILPLRLERGNFAGFAVYVHDHRGSNWSKDHRAIHSGLEPERHCQAKPDTWPLMILK